MYGPEPHATPDGLPSVEARRRLKARLATPQAHGLPEAVWGQWAALLTRAEVARWRAASVPLTGRSLDLHRQVGALEGAAAHLLQRHSTLKT